MITEPKLKPIGSLGGRPFASYRYGQFKIVQLPSWDPLGGSWIVGIASYEEQNPWSGRKVFSTLEEAQQFAHEQWLAILRKEMKL